MCPKIGGHFLFCKTCLPKVPLCPAPFCSQDIHKEVARRSVFIDNKINSLHVRCIHQHGAAISAQQWSITPQILPANKTEQTDPNDDIVIIPPISLPLEVKQEENIPVFKCTWTGTLESLPSHILNECGGSYMKCDECDANIHRFELKAHIGKENHAVLKEEYWKSKFKTSQMEVVDMKSQMAKLMALQAEINDLRNQVVKYAIYVTPSIIPLPLGIEISEEILQDVCYKFQNNQLSPNSINWDILLKNSNKIPWELTMSSMLELMAGCGNNTFASLTDLNPCNTGKMDYFLYLLLFELIH